MRLNLLLVTIAAAALVFVLHAQEIRYVIVAQHPAMERYDTTPLPMYMSRPEWCPTCEPEIPVTPPQVCFDPEKSQRRKLIRRFGHRLREEHPVQPQNGGRTFQSAPPESPRSP